MFTRRNFLGTSAAAATSVALCRPALAESNRAPARPAGSSDSFQDAFLKQRAELLSNWDPRQFLGYPVNRNLAPEGMTRWCQELGTVELGTRSMNNVGDPFHDDAPYASHTLERDVVQRFAGRYGFPEENTWGIVSHSGTDSNMLGAYIGSTVLKQRTGQKPKIFYTGEAHYSIQIIRDLLSLEEVLVRTDSNAAMDIEDLERQLARHPDAPVLLIATIGTTFKGGIDDIDEIQQRLRGRESYLHLDAALFGGYLQAGPHRHLLEQYRGGKRRYNSLAVSWHKFFGYPGVAGLFICGRDDFENHRDYFSQVHDPAYISHVPGTITCSRDPIKPAQVHYYSTRESLAQQQRDAAMMLDNAAYLQAQLHKNFPQLESQHVGPLSNTVYFRKLVSKQLINKWILATIRGKGTDDRGLAHVVVMPHADKALLDRFLNDLEDDLRS